MEICQRVFDQACRQKALIEPAERERLAAAIIHGYQDGVTNENSLMRLFSYPSAAQAASAAPATPSSRKVNHDEAIPRALMPMWPIGPISVS